MKVAVDLRPRLQPVCHQGLRPSCLAFATTAAHEGHLAAKSPLCVEFLFYHAVQRMPGAIPDGGTSMGAIRAALNDNGQPEEADWPYLAAQPAPGAWHLPSTIGQVWKIDSDIGALEFDDVKRALDRGQLVTLGLIITAGFMRCGADGTLPAIASDPERGGHAVLAVGHGETILGDPHILIRNSWGSAWGNFGHAWLSRGYIDEHLRETAVLKS